MFQWLRSRLFGVKPEGVGECAMGHDWEIVKFGSHYAAACEAYKTVDGKLPPWPVRVSEEIYDSWKCCNCVCLRCGEVHTGFDDAVQRQLAELIKGRERKAAAERIYNQSTGGYFCDGKKIQPN